MPAVLLSGSGEQEPSAGEPTLDITVDSIQRINPESNELVATVPLDFGVGGIALTDKAAWAIDADEGTYTLHRIDTETNTATETASIVGGPYGSSSGIGGVTEFGEITSGSDSVWAATTDRAPGSLGGLNDVNATVTRFDRGAAGSTGPTL